ncbi:acyl-CoA dehydrogenase [Citrobacter sp. RHB25-C09]|uniref:acyl-CoA dehydrogenase n=1 Tax=Citrobacter TaxID=544 RepID=UPI0015EF1BCF|nr:acyl-CoA dehydrogenase [Citrobacter sp. RHB25-C09]QMI03390.1 acyl-CoA dehydrogenase [Citrobacter sp. RHB25-C09]
MKKIIITLCLMASLPWAHAGEYIKRNGILSLSPAVEVAKFNINASHGDTSICEIQGEAISIAPTKNQQRRWIYSDQSSMCVAVISQLKNGSMQVMTRDCDTFCGVSALGAMDGEYRIRQ